MKIIDLLNKIANGEIKKLPVIIKNGEKFEEYSEYEKICESKSYIARRENGCTFANLGSLCSIEYFNDEIEIIEEPKKIEKLEPIYKIEQDMNLDSVIAWQKINNRIFQKKIDEIIDYINSKED